jgi:hypothetical protein
MELVLAVRWGWGWAWMWVSSLCINASTFTSQTHFNILIVLKFRKFHSSDYINKLLAVRFLGLKFAYDSREIRSSTKIPESWFDDTSVRYFLSFCLLLSYIMRNFKRLKSLDWSSERNCRVIITNTICGYCQDLLSEQKI